MCSVENEKYNKVENDSKGLTKQDLIELLQSDIVRSLKDSLAKALNRNCSPLWIQIGRSLGFILLLGSGLIGYYIQWKVEIKQREAEVITRQAEQVQKSIDQKIEWQIKLNNAMVNLKETRSNIVLDCQYKHALL